MIKPKPTLAQHRGRPIGGRNAPIDTVALRAARVRAGFSLERLGEALGVNSGTVWRWERGINSPSPARQAVIERLLRLRLGRLGTKPGNGGKRL